MNYIVFLHLFGFYINGCNFAVFSVITLSYAREIYFGG